MKPSWRQLESDADRKGMDLPLGVDSLPVKEIARAIAERADELGLRWRLVPATVAQPGTGGVMRVVLDADSEAIDATSMIGRLPVGGRVFVILSPPAGVHIVGFLGYDFPPSVGGEAVGRPRLIYNTADVTNPTTTVAVVPQMQFAAVPNAYYEVRLRASIGGPVATDTKVSWAGPAGVVLDRYVLGINDTATNNFAATPLLMGRRSLATAQVSGTFSGGAAGSSDFPGYWEDIIVKTAGTGGTVQVQFAANASGTVTFRAGSYMTVQRFR